MKNDEKFKISLIIPAHNEEKYLTTCLDSIFENYSNKEFSEIILIDNASTDKTAEVAKNYPGVKIVQEKEKGVVRARQKGFLESSGDILAYVDADTKIPPGWAEQIVYEFKKNKDLVCLSGPFFYYDVLPWKLFLVKIFWVLARPMYWLTGYMAASGNFAIKRSILQKMNGFDTTIDFFGDDTDMARRASVFGKVKFHPKFIIYTSGRRLEHHGLLKTSTIYTANFFSEILLKRPLTRKYKDVR